MEENELFDVLKFSSPNELYVVDEHNQLLKIVCPFPVRVLINIGALTEGEIVLVDHVKVTEQLISVFCIGESIYWFFYFDII